ncbi:uncharacterized protein PFL1_02593 [Pseudozyma flocculosa PF-1]|uniref:Related to aromatic amino acid aminotransferase I n=2 Tax=Pseudozyma flocculosa TaxID=84751 RepID=A0A5C3F1A0_9BASI|nr:uncharacterized protein PFL1_02593 [Pseudozyma flocculosa PF-1]EPQ29921.1 hypothetical protein PFL1_02593 [Pseudozyma flocculosa PF-1]SPO37229.1 related to aromatic amino acid aminotransferase I [Pseudozyma flocculosa]
MTAPTSASAKPIDYRSLLSQTARNRMPSAIRSLYPAELIPDMISLLSGKPNAETFPFHRILLELKPRGPDGIIETIPIEGADLDVALQYGPTAGIPKLVDWVEEFQSRLHHRPRVTKAAPGVHGEAWRCSFGTGSQDLLTKTFEALTDPGDSVIVESPAYSGILPSLVSLKARIFEAHTDAEGVDPIYLEQLLSDWASAEATRTSPFPKFIYTAPTGANPSGTTASEGRKRAVLSVARKHGLIILEDDPYYFLSFPGLGEDPVTRTRSKSYFALEQEEEDQWGKGRVLRFDSFSKILSAGLRLGFCTGPTELVDAIDADTSIRNLQPSGASQGIALALLSRWGIDGFLRHADSVAHFYKARLDQFEAKARHHLCASPSVAEWVTPSAGMFLWIKLKLPPTRPSDSGDGDVDEGDTLDLIGQKAKAAGVLALPGVAFMPPPSATGAGLASGTKRTSPYVRTSFSIVPMERVDAAFERLRTVVVQAWQEAGLEMI